MRGGGMIDAAEKFHLRIDHFDAGRAHLVDFGFAMQDKKLALLEATLEIAAVKKLTGELAGGILHEKMVDGVAPAHGAHGLSAHDPGADRVNALRLDILDVGEVDAVFVAEGEIVQEIVEYKDTALGKEFGALRADAFDHADFSGQGEGHRCVIYTIEGEAAAKVAGH